ncbi:hypothetical protein [Lysobacter gummosus]|uniref:hypothetical protein n=1 Tax=Lysobacter gummosus TaxID=262324 RepID=UPI00363A242F
MSTYRILNGCSTKSAVCCAVAGSCGCPCRFSIRFTTHLTTINASRCMGSSAACKTAVCR